MPAAARTVMPSAKPKRPPQAFVQSPRVPDGPAEVFIRPHELLAGPGEGGVLRLVHAEAGGKPRAVVEMAGAALDAVLHPPGAWAARGAPCRLSLRGAQVFGAGGARARATPLVKRAALCG
jgi:hypothetical protein